MMIGTLSRSPMYPTIPHMLLKGAETERGYLIPSRVRL